MRPAPASLVHWTDLSLREAGHPLYRPQKQSGGKVYVNFPMASLCPMCVFGDCLTAEREFVPSTK
jgi:hypothetical protein